MMVLELPCSACGMELLRFVMQNYGRVIYFTIINTANMFCLQDRKIILKTFKTYIAKICKVYIYLQDTFVCSDWGYSHWTHLGKTKKI